MSLASYLEITRLSPTIRRGDADKAVRDAKETGARAVCTSPHVAQVAAALAGTHILAVSVANFPFGQSGEQAVLDEVNDAFRKGAREVDVVAPLWLIADEDWAATRRWLATVRRAQGPLKLILETAALSERTYLHAAEIAIDLGYEWLKTSTGFHAAGGASLDAVRALVSLAGDRAAIKASGGIRSRAFAEDLLAAGAASLGVSRADLVLRH